MSKELPSLVIGDDVRAKVSDVFFDGHRYATYLYERSVDEESIANLSLKLTNEGIAWLNIASYEPPSPMFGEEQHRITFSTRMPSDFHRQGNILRHETEHFILAANRSSFQTRLKLAERASILGLLAVGGAIVGVEAAQAVVEATSSLPEIPRAASAVASDIGSAVLGGTVGGFYFMMLKTFSPEEFRAYRAHWRRSDELPDGTLQVAFR